jgi:hypothetical protein
VKGLRPHPKRFDSTQEAVFSLHLFKVILHYDKPTISCSFTAKGYETSLKKDLIKHKRL